MCGPFSRVPTYLRNNGSTYLRPAARPTPLSECSRPDSRESRRAASAIAYRGLRNDKHPATLRQVRRLYSFRDTFLHRKHREHHHFSPNSPTAQRWHTSWMWTASTCSFPPSTAWACQRHSAFRCHPRLRYIIYGTNLTVDCPRTGMMAPSTLLYSQQTPMSTCLSIQNMPSPLL